MMAKLKFLRILSTALFSGLTLAISALWTPAHAATVTIDWDAVTTNSDGSAISDLASYTLFRSLNDFRVSGVFMSVAQALADSSIIKTTVSGANLTHTVSTLADNTRYYFRLTAVDTAGNHSAFNVDSSGNPVQITILTPPSPCDLNASGTTDNADVQLAVAQSIGTATCLAHTSAGSADINRDGQCNAVDVQRIANAIGGTCVSP